MCEPCKNGRHRECESADCDCPTRKEDEAIDRELSAMNRQDGVYAEGVLSNLQYSGSATAKRIIDAVSRDSAVAFVAQVLTTAKALRC